MFEWFLMLEGIALAVIGGVAHITIIKPEDKVGHLICSVVGGICGFALFGEPSNVTAIPYMAIGFSAPVFLKKKFKDVLNKLIGGK